QGHLGGGGRRAQTRLELRKGGRARPPRGGPRQAAPRGPLPVYRLRCLRARLPGGGSAGGLRDQRRGNPLEDQRDPAREYGLRLRLTAGRFRLAWPSRHVDDGVVAESTTDARV